MNKATRTKLYNAKIKELKQHLNPDVVNNVVFKGLMHTYAKICVQEEELQKFVEENGMSYENVVSGVLVSRPEVQQLERTRRMKLQYSKDVFKYKHNKAEGDAFDKLIGGKG